VARTMFRLVQRPLHSSIFRRMERPPLSSPLDCETRIHTHHNPSTSLCEINYTLLALLDFVWDSVFFGIPRSARTYGLGPAGSGMHIIQPELRVWNDISFLTYYACSYWPHRLLEFLCPSEQACRLLRNCCLSSATGIPCHHDHVGCAICQNRNLLGEFNTRLSSGGSQNNHSNNLSKHHSNNLSKQSLKFNLKCNKCRSA